MIQKKQFLLLAALLLFAASPKAQENYTLWGSSHPSPTVDCGDYQWPLVQAPCPEVQIKQKHDHTPKRQYRLGERPWSNNPNDVGWDTVVDCEHQSLTLSCMPYIPVQYFNGYYAVDPIPYNPPDTTFCLGTRMGIGTDDVFASSHTTLDYSFFFFGLEKTAFRIGANGLVTFCSPSAYNSESSSDYCPYSFRASTNQLPWNATNGRTPNTSQYFNRMHDAIYGVYEDTDPAYFTGSTNNRIDGIYYGVQDEYPCRKIICSWKEAPDFSNHSKKGTYQIVCYEGSNIIEVHIKKHECCPSTSDALIGIQNADGNPQTTGALGSPTMQVLNNAPAAFFPANRNGFTNEFNYEAWRFTPQGNTQKAYEWYRILDSYDSITHEHDTVHLRNFNTDPTAADDTNGYFFPMGHISSCPNLTRAVVQPTTISRYVFHLKFRDANNNWYNLYDTIVIGVDDTALVTVRALDSVSDCRRLNVCAGSAANLMLEYPSIQVADTSNFSVIRRSNGQNIELPVDQCLDLGLVSEGPRNTTQPITLRANLPSTGLIPNKIDSVYVQASLHFSSHCSNFDTMLVCFYPNFVIDVDTGICQGQALHWDANGQSYNTSVHATVTLQSTPGCDSTVNLNLTVYDKSYNIDHVEDCKPYTWINGQTYYESNGATASIDTVQSVNRWGCDSTVQLEFTYLPVTAQIQTDRDFFDFDHLDAVLTDVSLNNDTRTWVLPGGTTLSGPVAYYTIPAEYDEADIWLLARSPYGCVDSTHIVIPMRKESFWVPNIFTPESASGNNTFGSISTRTLTQEMHIYNRNGQLVFHCETPDCQWDGRDASGNLCPQGTYTYLIRYTNEFLPKVVHVLRGTVTLIR